MENKVISDSISQEELIKVINTLSKKKRDVGLTIEEQALQKNAYAVYLKRFRAQFNRQLDGVKIKDPDGTITPLKEYAEKHPEFLSKNN